MSQHHFLSYSNADGDEVALQLVDQLVAGPPSFRVWLDKRDMKPGMDWDEQLAEAIGECEAFIYLMTRDSVQSNSNCKQEWSRALSKKKPIIPVKIHGDAEAPFRLATRQCIDLSNDFERGLAQLRRHLVWLRSPEGELSELEYALADARRELPRSLEADKKRVQESIAALEAEIRQRRSKLEPRRPSNPIPTSSVVGATASRAMPDSAAPEPDVESALKRARVLRADGEEESGLVRFDKLREAHAVLSAASQRDPSNVDVLLELASLLVELTPDDHGDERKIFKRVTKLLADPTSDRQSFQLAQARFHLASDSANFDAEGVREAQVEFERLGRADWARRCREVLVAAEQSKPIPYPAASAPPPLPTQFEPTRTPTQPISVPPFPSPASFVGNWRIDVMDMLQSKMNFTYHPNGACQGSQDVPLLGPVHFQGSWYFDPSNRVLGMTGMIGFTPMNLGIMVVGQTPDGFQGVDANNIGYVFHRA